MQNAKCRMQNAELSGKLRFQALLFGAFLRPETFHFNSALRIPYSALKNSTSHTTWEAELFGKRKWNVKHLMSMVIIYHTIIATSSQTCEQIVNKKTFFQIKEKSEEWRDSGAAHSIIKNAKCGMLNSVLSFSTLHFALIYGIIIP